MSCDVSCGILNPLQKSSELAQRYGRDVGLLENAITDMKSLVTMEQAKCKEFHAAVVAKEKELAEVRECVCTICTEGLIK